jgi:hypothetical protein
LSRSTIISLTSSKVPVILYPPCIKCRANFILAE